MIKNIIEEVAQLYSEAYATFSANAVRNDLRQYASQISANEVHSYVMAIKSELSTVYCIK